MIPKILQDKRIRFCLVKIRDKKAFEKGWDEFKNTYSYDSPRLIEWINKGGNYGVCTGHNNLIVVDYDDKNIEKEKSHLLPETFSVKTGKGGLHQYFFCDGEVPKTIRVRGLDIQMIGAQVVGAGSTHPNGNKYEVLKDVPIATIEIGMVKSIFEEYLEEKDKKILLKKDNVVTQIVEGEKEDKDDMAIWIKNNIKVTDMMKEYGYDFSKNPTECLLHPSNSGTDFSYDEKMFHCFGARCGKTGNVIQLVMLHEGCTYFEAKQILRKKIQSKDKNKDHKNIEEMSLEEIKKRVVDTVHFKDRDEATEIITKYIENKYSIYTTRDDEKAEMWIYDEGVYIPQGRTYVKEICRFILDKWVTSQLVNLVLLKIEMDTYIEQDKFFANQNVDLVAVKNGILNLKTKELQPFTPKLIFFNKLPVDYEPTQKNEHILKFFEDILPDQKDIVVLQEIFGFVLLRDYKFEKAFMFLGSGRNGKGKTVELMKRFLGIENCANISLQSLDNDNFAIGELFNKLVNLSADLSKTALEETGNFKSLTGHDLVSAPRKFLTRVHFVNYAKMIFCANDLPVTHDNTNAFFMRWILIDFPYTFIPKQEYDSLPETELFNKKIQDPQIIEKISTPEEMSGLLNWALIGLDRLIQNNGFSVSFTSEQVRNKWGRKSSSLNAFIMDCVVEEESSRITKREFRNQYNLYCKIHKLTSEGDREIKKALKETVGAEEQRSWENDEFLWYWKGIRLNEIKIDLNHYEKQSSLPKDDVTRHYKDDSSFQNELINNFFPMHYKTHCNPCNTLVTPLLDGDETKSKVKCDSDSLNEIGEEKIINEKDIFEYIQSKGINGGVKIEQIIEDLKIDDDFIETLKKKGDVVEHPSGTLRRL